MQDCGGFLSFKLFHDNAVYISEIIINPSYDLNVYTCVEKKKKKNLFRGWVESYLIGFSNELVSVGGLTV